MSHRLARALVLSASGLLLAVAARGQISPGPLTSPHAELDGSGDCLACHAKGEGVSAERCLTCHEILRERIRSGAGLHARPGYEDCRLCHIEHHGRDYELVWWGEGGIEGFDHGLTGEPLRGKHRELACRDCHRADHVARPETLLAVGKDLGRTYLGLSPECASCHVDEHRGQFEGAACDACHGLASFAPAEAFDHDVAAFALDGRHVDVTCAQCHVEETSRDGVGETFTRFRPVPHRQCSSCHSDPHEGALGTDCASCHVTPSWQSTPGFDHAKTRFPLTGRHVRVACAGCHRTPGGTLRFTGLAFAACTDCHRDPHESRLGGDCASCHRTSGWELPRDGAFDHGLTRFALLGAHATVDCSSCHRPGEPLAVAGFERCSTCHADEHLGQFARRADGGACDSCHSVERFVPASFTETDHAESRFPLTGLHRGVPCVDCHRETSFRRSSDGEIVTTAKFGFATLECSECHADPHEGTADAWLVDAGCAACHSAEGWQVPVFDHSRTEFVLEEGHRDVPCADCHRSEESADDRRPLVLVGLGTECAGCHAEPHGGQFAGRPGGCASCHVAIRWTDLTFEHATVFVLQGAHARTECAACHPTEPPPPGAAEPMVRYVPVPTTCEGCHAGSG